MKKLLILILLPILLGGCYDYNELGDLAILSGVGIDFVDGEYEVTFEILSTKKEGDNSSASSTYNVTARGKTITEAFAKNGNNSDKVPYYDHIEVVIISEEIAKNHLEEVSEYLIRASKLRNEFYLTIAKDESAKKIISSSSKEKPIASTFIVSLLEHSKDTDSAGYYATFTTTLRNMITGGEDAIISTFTLKDKKIVLDGMAVFKDFKLKHIYNTNEAAKINLLNNFKTKTVFFTNSCKNNKQTVISIYESDLKIEPFKDHVEISGKLNARINEDNCGLNLRDQKVYIELEKEFSKIIEKELNNTIESLKRYDTNVLSIGKSYYNKYREKNYLLWTHQKFTYDLNLKINKKGLVFEVKE